MTRLSAHWHLRPALAATLAATFALTATSAFAADAIPWRSGAVTLTEQTPRDVAAALRSATEARSTPVQHVVVQFSEPVADNAKTRLSTAGVQLLTYLGGHAYFAAVDGRRLDAAAIERETALVAVAPVQPEWKLHRTFLANATPPWAVVDARPDGGRSVAAYILFHSDVDVEQDGRSILAEYGAEVRGTLDSIHGAVIHLDEAMVPVLAMEDAVQWIEPPLPAMEEINNHTRERTQAGLLQAAPYNLTGAGVSVLVYDGGTGLASHLDFQGRLTAHDGSGVSYHSTHVAGTIGGAGIANALYKGQAPGVTLISYGLEQAGGLQQGFLYTDPCDLQNDYSTAINTYGADISNNSIGTNTAPNGYPCEWEGNYGVTDVLIDTIVRGDGSNPLFAQPFRIVWANGNERSSGRCGTTYLTTAPPACAKNHITVGALDWSNDAVSSFTSWGPAEDGRMKPDVSAPGVSVTSCDSAGTTAYTTLSGTSMASPATCGAAALLMQDFRAQFPGQPDMRNSTLKILLAQTAQDVVNTGPDYQTGYGSIRIKDAVDFMRTGNFLEASLGQGGTYSVLVVVQPGDPVLKITAAWDDYPGTPGTGVILVNDLDLRVYDPAQQIHYPWTLGGTANPAAAAVQTSPNHVDNIEQVLVNNPTPGTWVVEVFGFNVPQGPQPFSLCAAPLLIACSPTGLLVFDQPSYACSDVVGLRVVDCDLNADDQVVETCTATLASNSEPGGETVLLTETGPQTADFRGTMTIAPANSPGVLLVGPGDTLTATYIDADDGHGGLNVPVTADAALDCVPPLITNIRVESVGSDSATIAFDTSDAAQGSVRFGTACGSLTTQADGPCCPTTHTIELTGLAFDTRYYFAVDATDTSGNAATDDNSGVCYNFRTPNVVYDFPLDSNPGWSVQGQWAFGHPTGGGSSNHDPSNGHTGTNVYGYNLAGDYASNLPATYLTTTALDCTGITDVTLAFWRWLGVESNSHFDEATVEVSNNGTNWTVVWRATDTGVDVADTAWVYQEFDISAVADNQPTVYVRWGMGPTDTNLTFPGWNIDDVRILANSGGLSIAFPNGRPALLPPGQPTDVAVRINPGSEQYVPDTGRLYFRYNGGAFQSTALTPLGGDLYQATLPSANCPAVPEYYFAAEGTLSGVVYSPATAPSSFYSAGVGVSPVLLDDNFQTDQGWTTQVAGATAGQWQRGVPVNDPSWEYDPVSDGDGSGQCYLTQNVVGNTDVDNGTVRLLTPVLDMSAGGVEISYLYFLRLTDTGGAVDALTVEISSNADAGPWIEIARHTTDGGLLWRSNTITADDLIGGGITFTANMKLRFSANDANTQSIVEAGLDRVRITAFYCTPFTDCNVNNVPDADDIALGTSTDLNGTGVPDECESVGDMNCDGTTDFGDINPFVTLLVSGEAGYYALFPACDHMHADCNGDGSVTFGDINPFVTLLLN